MEKQFSLYFFIFLIISLIVLAIVLPDRNYSDQENKLEQEKFEKPDVPPAVPRKTKKPKKICQSKDLVSVNLSDLSNAEKWSEVIKQAYPALYTRGEKHCPPLLFSTDFMISIQLTESLYKKDAVSPTGAVGVMQMTKIAILETTEYLEYLKREDLINIPRLEKLNSRDIRYIKNEMKNDADLARAYGKTYLYVLYNKNNIGRPEYVAGNINIAQKQLAYAYNGGPTKYKKPKSKWSKEMKNYGPVVMNYKKRIENIRAAFHKKGLIATDYEVMVLAREMQKFSSHKQKYIWLDKKINSISG